MFLASLQVSSPLYSDGLPGEVMGRCTSVTSFSLRTKGAGFAGSWFAGVLRLHAICQSPLCALSHVPVAQLVTLPVAASNWRR